MSSPYPAPLIAYAFVVKGIQEHRPITQMKLQKLVYLAHGVYMVFNNNEPLIREEFEAWQFGPVVPNIYRDYRSYGSAAINDFSFDYSGELERQHVALMEDEKAVAAIDYVWEIAKNLSAYSLSNWTHLKGSPWDKTYTPGVYHIPINNTTIATFFKELLNKANEARTPAAT